MWKYSIISLIDINQSLVYKLGSWWCEEHCPVTNCNGNCIIDTKRLYNYWMLYWCSYCHHDECDDCSAPDTEFNWMMVVPTQEVYRHRLAKTISEMFDI